MSFLQSDKGREIVYCKKCLTPSSRPRIQFDEHGVCNACTHSSRKQVIDWAARREEFLSVLDQFRSKDGSWDCIVPWSGGKDSSAIAYKLKHEFGMNPLLVTCSPMIPNEVGVYNREALLKEGFDQVFCRPNQAAMRHLAKRFFVERGNAKIAWEAGKEAIPIQAAVRYNIPLVFYAEHGESEYGGKVLSEDHLKFKDFTEIVENIVGDDAANWEDDVVSASDLNFMIYPKAADIEKLGMRIYYYSYFFKWSMYENYEFLKDKIDFKVCPEGRTIGTFTNFDSLDDKIDDLYYYLQYIKFGFGRAVRDGSRMLQNGHITREQALEYVHKYDGEFPVRDIADVLEYLDMSMDEFLRVIDKHRNPEIWKREDDRWMLRYPLPTE